MTLLRAFLLCTCALGVGAVSSRHGHGESMPLVRREWTPQSAESTLQLAEATNPHELRVSPFFRYAHYDCQKKGDMLQAFPDKSVLEIGAHDGEEWKEFTNQNMKNFWTVEPSPDKEPILQQNELKFKAASPQTHFERFRMAISTQTGVMKFWVDANNSEQNTVGHPPPWVTQKEFDEKAIKVNVSTLDDLWKNQLRGQHITMIKSDTQGHEPGVIMSGKELFEKDPPEIVHIEYSPGLINAAHAQGAGIPLGQDMLEFLYGHGYLCFDCDAFNPPPLDSDKRDIKTYHEYFKDWMFKGVNHGAWTDLVCLH